MNSRILESDRDWLFYHNEKWPYDQFLKTYILKMMDFGFVRDNYDRSIVHFRYPEAVLAPRFNTLPVRPAGTAWFLVTLEAIENAGAATLFRFIQLTVTRKQAEVFIKEAGIPQLSLMAAMDFFKQWWFPFGAQLRQLVEDTDQTAISTLDNLKSHGYAQGFKLLDTGRKPEGRLQLAAQTGIPEAVLRDLTHRADVTRIPYVSGSMVKRFWAVGIDTLEKLVKSDPEDIYARMCQLYAARQKAVPFDAKLEYLRELIADARRIPVVFEA